MKYKLDYSKAQTMQISNDAFFYLYQEEEPLDDENLEEAKEILEMFPNGFFIDENWKTVDDSDLIEAKFIPFVEDNDDYDEYLELTKYVHIQIKWIDSSHIKAWWYNIGNGTRELYGEFEVCVNKYGNRYFMAGESKNSSLFYMKQFIKRK